MTDSKFLPGNFAALAATAEGQQLWRFLTGEKAIACMETATYLKKPALEGLQPWLLKTLGDWIRKDSSKQMAGAMVRQVMESRGYRLERRGVRVRDQMLFSTASRYTKESE